MRSNMHKRHRIPRKQPMNTEQKVCVWLIIILLAQLALALTIGGGAEAKVLYDVGEWPETEYRWANVNAYRVNFREWPDLEAPVAAQYSVGTCVEVVNVWDGWAEVLHHNHLGSGALYVWAEYLDFVD